METTISTMSIFPSSKDEVAAFSNKMISELESGNANPLDVLRFQKCFEKVFENVKPTLMDMARTEAEKYGAKKFEYKGLKMELAEVGTKYDFSGCNDTEWNELDQQAKDIAEKKKHRETLLKSLTEAIDVIDKYGEAKSIMPPVKSSTSSIKVTV
jgi:hypothetical protein